MQKGCKNIKKNFENHVRRKKERKTAKNRIQIIDSKGQNLDME